MNKLTAMHGDQVKWIEFLIRFIGDDEIAALQGQVERALNAPVGAAPEDRWNKNADHLDGSTSGRLLNFYIGRAWKRIADSQPDLRGVAQRELEEIQGLLAERSATPARTSAPPSSADPVIQSQVDVPAEAAAPPPPEAIDEADSTLTDAIRLIYRLVLKRETVDEEIAIWKEHFANGLRFDEFLVAIHGGDEARAVSEAGRVDVGSSDGVFVRDLFRIVEGRGCNGYELDAIRRRLETGAATRQDLLVEFFARALEQDRSHAGIIDSDEVQVGLFCAVCWPWWMRGARKRCRTGLSF